MLDAVVVADAATLDVVAPANSKLVLVVVMDATSLLPAEAVGVSSSALVVNAVTVVVTTIEKLVVKVSVVTVLTPPRVVDVAVMLSCCELETFELGVTAAKFDESVALKPLP